MSYNFLRYARSIKNSDLCRYDNLDGYSSDFHINGDVDGWDVYYNIYLYGCWKGILFGTSHDRECYISRSNVFNIVAAEDYYYIKLMMKITNNNTDAAVETLTKGRIQWTRLGDSNWDDRKQMDFDIYADDKWHLYIINMGPQQWWQGNITNLRIYPFINGKPKDQFAIKFIKISSLNKYSCTNTQCSYYTQYTHPCPGAGSKGTCESGIPKSSYTTISGINDGLIVNINGYGNEYFSLGNNTNLSGQEMARLISNKISTLNIGGYNYALCEYTKSNTLKITSGSVGSDSYVTVSGAAAEALGFYKNGEDVSIKNNGTNPASGFDYASSRLLSTLEISKLMNGKKDDLAYSHAPSQYNVEGGRRDFNKIGTGQLLDSPVPQYEDARYYTDFNNKGKTIIDFSHPIDNNGRITSIYICGIVDSPSKVKIFRPYSDGSLKVIYSLNIPFNEGDHIYTAHPTVYRVDCDLLVEKGDILGVYNANLYVGMSALGIPDATFVQVFGDVTGKIYPKKPLSFGIGGFAIYARGTRFQSNVCLDIDFGDRINIEELNIYGEEKAGYFEFNIASCKDVNWSVDLFGGTHKHTVCPTYDPFCYVDTHQNIAYGLDALDDGITTPDNGQEGSVYGSDSNGLWTMGQHAYFYVNGDAEWLYQSECTGKTEYCGDLVATSTDGFVHDPIAFTLKFPYEFEAEIHKSIIYFKERYNFRSIALSYYKGKNYSAGNADDPRFEYIPEYTSIYLDGIAHYPDDGQSINDYIFKNPTNPDPIYGLDGHPINWQEVEAAAMVDWTILEHNFEPIICKGFRIFTNYHYSTKINEIEVYSRMKTTPSLVDNITLYFSDYGDMWTPAIFEKKNDDCISAFIGGSPRYFRLELDSSTEFILNEIEFLVNDQVKTEKCDDVILLDHAKARSINDSTAIEIENVYDKAFDLYVDLPKEISNTDDIIFWSKLGSYEEIYKPEIGPPCKLYKQDDYTIVNANMQCAINVPAYGLKNLVDGKKAYYTYNEDDWQEFGTLASGTSLDFCNSGRIFVKRSEFELISPYSAKYWKVQCTSAVSPGLVDVFAYENGSLLDIEKIYYNSSPSVSKQTNSIDSDGHTHIDIYDDDFTGPDGSSPDTSKWSVHPNTGATIQLMDNSLEIISTRYTYYSYIKSIYALSGDFDVEIDFNYISEPEDSDIRSGFELKIESGSEYIYSKVAHYNNKRYWINGGKTLGGSRSWGSGDHFPYYTNGKLRTIRKGDNILLLFQNGDGVWHELNYQQSWSYFTFTNNPVTIILGLYQADSGTWKVHADNFKVNYGIACLNTFGFKLKNDAAVDKIKLYHSDGSLNDVSVYISPDNTDNYILAADNITGNLNITTNNQNYNTYLAIDLEKRHDIDIIRNYGDSVNKLWISTSVNTGFSNSETNNVFDMELDNSTKEDARWVIVKLLCGDGIVRYIRKLGIYPNIKSVFCRDGGYNCEWLSLGNILSDYEVPINVAYGSTVTGTNYYFNTFYPNNAVDGIFDNYSFDACWGFQKIDNVDPYLEIEFDEVKLINKVVLYHGYNPGDTSFMNIDYKFSVSSSDTDPFVDVFSITNNNQHTRIHQFDPVYAKRARLTITKYNSQKIYITTNEDTGEPIFFDGSFLREIEIYTYVDKGYIDSETWPIVCMDLKDQFNIVGHDLINKNTNDINTNWDNSEEFFKYSDMLTDDPKKVSFNSDGDYRVEYEKIDTFRTDPNGGPTEYIFNTIDGSYFYAGKYFVEYDAYAFQNLYDDNTHLQTQKLSLRLEGPSTIDFFADITGIGTWLHQLGSINIPEDGFYIIKGVQHVGADNGWGVRNPIIYRSVGLRKWIAIKRDTAENYSYDNDENKYGKDYLSLIKVYGDEKYNPVEYSWWWKSTLSSLTNDYLYVKEGKRSLQIHYPASSGVDTISFIEGDDFGSDNFFECKDFLHFWWYIDDINNLDTNYGNITFGVINDSAPAYYMWDINNLNLKTGWNEINLKFESADHFYPFLQSYYMLSGYISEDLDFRKNDRNLSSFRIIYKGVGNPLVMNIDKLSIKRNVFDDDVKFGKGLCLTGYDYLEIPISNVTLEKGTIEFWVKLYTDTYGRNRYGDFNSRVLFTLINNNNNLITLGIKSGSWFEISSGHIRESLNIFSVENTNLPISEFYNINDIIHIAVVWSNDGRFTDNGDTVRFYINGNLICASKTKWELGDTKSALLKLGGATSQLVLNKDAYGSAIFDNVKVYNYCKYEFDIERECIEERFSYSPNEFLEISKNNIDFYGLGSPNLPLIYKSVPPGEKRTVYIRSNKFKDLKTNNTTATLILDWLITV